METSALQSAAVALLIGEKPQCSDFDLRRWGLDLYVAPRARSRSRSPRGKGASGSKGGKADKGGKGGKTQRAGLEPQLIKLMRAWWKHDWGTVEQVCCDLYRSRENIAREIDKALSSSRK
jgi:hypothetical protein